MPCSPLARAGRPEVIALGLEERLAIDAWQKWQSPILAFQLLLTATSSIPPWGDEPYLNMKIPRMLVVGRCLEGRQIRQEALAKLRPKRPSQADRPVFSFSWKTWRILAIAILLTAYTKELVPIAEIARRMRPAKPTVTVTLPTQPKRLDQLEVNRPRMKTARKEQRLPIEKAKLSSRRVHVSILLPTNQTTLTVTIDGPTVVANRHPSVR